MQPHTINIRRIPCAQYAEGGLSGGEVRLRLLDDAPQGFKCLAMPVHHSAYSRVEGYPAQVFKPRHAHTFEATVKRMRETSSGSAIVLSTKARSATERPRHPLVLSVDHANDALGSGTRPMEGRKPTTLQNAAGLRSEPPVSEPLAIGTRPQANATAAPPEDPPQVFVRS